MKTTTGRILAISDPMKVAGYIKVVSDTCDQIYNPSASIFTPNRSITYTELRAGVSGADPNNGYSELTAKSAKWIVDGKVIYSGNADYVISPDTLTMQVKKNGSVSGGNIDIQCIISYVNTTTGRVQQVRAEKVLTTTVHDTFQIALTPTTTVEQEVNPMKEGAVRIQDFGCKLVAGTSQIPAKYYWYVRTTKNGVASDVKVTGTENWFKGSKYYTYERDNVSGDIVADSWKLNDGGEVGTWATITIDVTKTEKLMLVCKALPVYAGVADNNKLQNNYQQTFRMSMHLPLLKKVTLQSVQGYTTKHNANPEASHYKAYVNIYVGSQELNGSTDTELIEEFFSVIWYKRINNINTIIGYGANLDISYKNLGINTVNIEGVDVIDKTTIPEIFAEVSENYISGGVQGAVYSNYEKPNPKAVFGNDSIVDELTAYLVETTYNEDGTTTIDAKRLMKNNWFRFENGQPAPTLLCTQKQYETAKASTEYNNNGEQTYLGVPVACYNPTGIDKNLDILYGWSEPVWTIEMHTNNSGEVVCYFAKEPFEIEEDGKVLEAVKIPPTLICPGLPTLHNGKFRTMFFMPNCGYGSRGEKGFAVYTFAKQEWTMAATGISNNNNNTYSFAKNKDANSDNTPYAPLMHWHYNNILCALETKLKSAILHDESMFGAGISSNLPFTEETRQKRTGVRIEYNGTTTYQRFSDKPIDLYYKKSDGTFAKDTWSALLSKQSTRMICLEPQLVVSWAVEQKNNGNGVVPVRFNCPLAFVYGASDNAYQLYGVGHKPFDSTMDALVCGFSMLTSDTDVDFYNESGTRVFPQVSVYRQMSCIHGIDLVSADVFQCQNGIENILTVEKEGNVDGNPRTIWICKNQNNLYRGTDKQIASGEKYPFETDGTYELLGESKPTTGWGNDFLRGTCIPSEDGGGLSKISGYCYTINYGNTTKGNRNRMGIKGRGYADNTNASARLVYASTGASSTATFSAGGFQIRLPEPTTNEIDQLSYGIEFDTTNPSPTCERIGNMNFHRSLPVQSQMVGVLLDDDGNEVKVLSDSDWQNASLLDGSQGQVMIRIPAHFRKFDTIGTKRRVRLSTHALDGFHLVPMSYVSAYEATVDRDNNMLASVKNATAKYRGGNNNESWDGTYRSLLGMPATSISRTNFRSYARKRKEGSSEWNCMTYDIQKTLYWLFVTEFATLNSQASFVEHPNYAAMHRGGLGDGVTTLNSTKWDAFNSYNPIIPCGTSDSLGNKTGGVVYTMPTEYDTTTTTTVKVNRYRGIENPFGHIWKWTDGINVRISPDTENGGDGLSKVYVCSDPSKFNDSDYNGYQHVGNEARAEGYVKEIVFGEGGEVMPSVVGGSSTQFHCDYHYTNIPKTEALRGVLFGGIAYGGAYAGLASAGSHYAPSDAIARIGSRLCFIPQSS